MYLLDNLTGKEALYKTKFTFKETRKSLFFSFVCYHSKFFSYSEKYNSELYRGDVCEIFINYGKNNHYYEIEVAPNGTIFLSDIENDGKSFKGTLIEKCFIKAKAKIKNNRYIVKIKISKEMIPTKIVEYNAFRIETDGGKENAHLFALHPTLSETFHKKEFIF